MVNFVDSKGDNKKIKYVSISIYKICKTLLNFNGLI